MMVVVVNNAPPRLRGRLAVWMSEIRAGVYVGDFSSKTREVIWTQVQEGIEYGDAILVWKSQADQGYSFATQGRNRRLPIDVDGLTLIQIPPDQENDHASDDELPDFM